MEVKAPVDWLIEYIETVFALLFATYTKRPVGSVATEKGFSPEAIAVVMEVKAPVDWLIEYIETVSGPKFATYTKRPVWSVATE
jgi:hypothetical protein